MGKALALSTAATVTLCGVPAASVAQSDGVTVDPGTPAGKEYAIPLEEARRNNGDKPADAPSTGATEYRSDAFGDGIESDDKNPGVDRTSEGSAASNSDDVERTSSSTGPAAVGDDSGGPSAGAVTGGLLLLVIGGGVLVAWLMRRSGQTNDRTV